MTELRSGLTLGRYELLVRIGRGRAGVVWVARVRGSSGMGQQLVAVKALLPELASRPEFRTTLATQIRLLSAVQHPNLVRVHELAEDRGILFVVMDWVEGDSLANLQRYGQTRGGIPMELLVRIASDTAAGLHVAHELRDRSGGLRGIVHGNVTANNILLGIDGRAKIVDFGIAPSIAGLPVTQDPGQGFLTPCSPEQARGQNLDRRADIFALGAVLFEATTGEPLWDPRQAARSLALFRGAGIPRPTQHHTKYPPRLETILLKALEAEPDRRYPDASALERALNEHLSLERAAVPPSAVSQLLDRVMGERLSKRRDIVTAVGRAVGGPGAGEQATPEFNADTSLWLSDKNSVGPDLASTPATSRGVAAAAAIESEAAASGPRPLNPSPARLIALLGLPLVLAASVTYMLAPRRSPLAPSPSPATASASPGATAKPTLSEHLAPAAETRSAAENLPEVTESASEQAVARAGSEPLRPERRGPQPAPEEITLEEEPARDAVVDAGAISPPPTDASVPSANAERQGTGFDRAEALAALSAASVAARSCRSRGDAPTGPGRAVVTFASDGTVAYVNVSERFEGSPIGQCVAFHFRQARVSAFTGDSQTLYQGFLIPQ